MDLTQLETFLTLGEELHFGRTAERLYVSQPRVSRLVAALEREIGGPLFDRTSRRVRLTPLGARLHKRLQVCRWELHAALDDAHAAAREAAGVLRIGFTQTTGGEAFSRLVKAVEAQHPDCEVQLTEVEPLYMYESLRHGEVDVFVNWQAVDEPIRDMPVMPLGLIWCTAHENARIRACAQTAASLVPQRTSGLADLLVSASRPPRGGYG